MMSGLVDCIAHLDFVKIFGFRPTKDLSDLQGWKIRAAFLQLDGPAVRMDYQKIITAGVSPQIQDYELQAIMAANTPPGTSWKPKMYDNPNSPNKGLAKFGEAYIANAIGEKMWQRRTALPSGCATT